MNEVILYSELNEYTTSQLIYQLNWIGENQVYAVRMYCPGGDVEATWGIPAKMQELKQKGCHSIAKVDGMAASMAGVLLIYFDERQALDVSNIMLHRAAYPEKDSKGDPTVLTPEEKQRLFKINTDIKTKMLQVIDNDKLKKLKGVSIDDLFDEKKERVSLWLTAEEAKEIGLITKIVPIDAKSSQNMVKAVAACYGVTQGPKATAATADNQQTNTKKMTAEEFQKENPEAFKSIQAAAGADAVKAYKEKAKAALEIEDGDGGASKGKPETPSQVDPQTLAVVVEATLKAMGVPKIEASQQPQTAAATGAQTAQAEAENEAAKKAKAEAEKKVVDDCKSEIENIKAGKV